MGALHGCDDARGLIFGAMVMSVTAAAVLPSAPGVKATADPAASITDILAVDHGTSQRGAAAALITAFPARVTTQCL